MRRGFGIAGPAGAPAKNLESRGETIDDRREVHDFGVDEQQGKRGALPVGKGVGRAEKGCDPLCERRRGGVLVHLVGSPVRSDTEK